MTDKAEIVARDRQADRDMNKKQDRRCDGALGHVKATGVAAALLAPAARGAKRSWGEGTAGTESKERRL